MGAVRTKRGEEMWELIDLITCRAVGGGFGQERINLCACPADNSVFKIKRINFNVLRVERTNRQ